MEENTNKLNDSMTIIHTLCRKHKVGQLFVFGSVLTDRFTPQSDIDFAVCFDDVPMRDYADNYFNLKNGLQQVVGRPVDLVEYNAISNPYFRRSVDATKQLLYG